MQSAPSSCEIDRKHQNDPGLLSVAAGNTAYFFDADRPGYCVKKHTSAKAIGGVAVDKTRKKMIIGGGTMMDPVVHVYDWNSDEQIGG